jgi:hypothetical protein
MVMDEVVGTLLGTALGGLIAAAVSFWQGQQARERERETFDRAQKAARDKEVRERADGKADEILNELETLEKLYFEKISLTPYLSPEDRMAQAQVRETLSRISGAAAYLQQPLRRHVELATRVLPDADQLGSQRFVKETPRSIGRELIAHAQDMVGRYLRNDPVPTALSERQMVYQKGWDLLQEYIEEQIEEQMKGPT